jgi:hypothetical protein
MRTPDHAPPPRCTAALRQSSARRRGHGLRSGPICPRRLGGGCVRSWRVSWFGPALLPRRRGPLPAHTPPPRRGGGMTPTLHDPHGRRLALVSVRQSPPHQGVEPVESTARPDACVDRAVAWGWARARVVVRDEDQGQRGQRMVTR